MSSLKKTSTKRIKATGKGAHHWWLQRLTAVALVFLVSWFVLALAYVVHSSGGNILVLLKSPLHATMLILLILVGLYHGFLGMKVIIEDYVSCPYSKTTLLVIVSFVSVFLAIITTIATVTVHVDMGNAKEKYGKHYSCNKNKNKSSHSMPDCHRHKENGYNNDYLNKEGSSI